jgi:hypothetical protein
MQELAEPSETAEKVDFVGRDPIDAETRRPYGRSAGLGAAAETNLLPRNGPPDSVPDFFSGLVEKRHNRESGVEPGVESGVKPVVDPFAAIGANRLVQRSRGNVVLGGRPHQALPFDPLAFAPARVDQLPADT